MFAVENGFARRGRGALQPRAWKTISIICAMICGFGWTEPVSADAEYEFTLIEAFEVDYTLREVILRDINESGFVTGTATHNGFYDGFTWTAQTDKVIVPLTWPIGLNNANQTVSNGLIYDFGSGTSINVPPAGIYPVPRLQDINDNGVAVGYSECNCSNSDRILQQALLWDGASHTIPVPGAKELLRINNANVAVGNIGGGSAGLEGFVYHVDTGTYVNMTDMLPPYMFGRGWSELQDISESNTVTGRGWDGQFIRGLVWSQEQGFTFLPALPGGLIDRVYPRAINASGTVVGNAHVTLHNPHAFIWTPGDGMRDLNDLVATPPDFILDWAIQINDQGWIIGIGHYGPNWGTSRGFVLRPLSAPTAANDVAADFARPQLHILPNPVKGDLVVRFALRETGIVHLSVFDVAGRKVATVRESEFPAGTHTIPWKLTPSLPAGVYIARLETAESTRVRRFVLIR